MNKATTERGFDIYVFEDSYGNECSLQKSSNACEDKIWLGVNNVEPKIMATDAIKLGIQNYGQNTGWVPFYVPEEVQFTNRMHLTREQVKDLLPILKKFVKTGEI
jgi:hypothetical protein